MVNPTTTIRFSEAELRVLEGLSKRLDRSRSDLVRAAVRGFGSVVVMAAAEGERALAELRRRYPGGLLAVGFEQRDDGEFIPTLTIDGDVVDDFQAFAFGPTGVRYIVVQPIDSRDVEAAHTALELKVMIGAHFNVVVGLHVGTLPWPPQRGAGIVRKIADIEAGLPAETRELLEPVGT
jgi:predicted transcriptional regulator